MSFEDFTDDGVVDVRVGCLFGLDIYRYIVHLLTAMYSSGHQVSSQFYPQNILNFYLVLIFV